MTNLVIFESAAKAKKAQGYLGSGYKCITSKGHCIDLPKRKFGVDLNNDFEPTYVTMPDSKTTLTEIKKLAKASDTVYLMADPDRETKTHPFEDPLGASRLSFEWGWDGTDQLTDSSYHALRSLHYAFAVVEEFLFLTALATMDTLLDRDARPLKVDNCRAVKHAIKSLLTA